MPTLPMSPTWQARRYLLTRAWRRKDLVSLPAQDLNQGHPPYPVVINLVVLHITAILEMPL